VGAHLALRRRLPAGSGERARATALALALVVPLLGAGLAIDAVLDGPPGVALKLLLGPLAVAGAFALGLVTPYDLEKVSSLPLSAAWMRRTRDTAVAVGDRLARVVALRRIP
jgi:hypothetical protein